MMHYSHLEMKHKFIWFARHYSIQTSKHYNPSLPGTIITRLLSVGCRYRRHSKDSSSCEHDSSRNACQYLHSGHTISRIILELKELYEAYGADTSEGNGRHRAPNWTKEESARLCHVITDSRHATVVSRMYQRIQSREELDAGRHDPRESAHSPGGSLAQAFLEICSGELTPTTFFMSFTLLSVISELAKLFHGALGFINL
eukprot:IDg23720t1